jgi:hypothetical protein
MQIDREDRLRGTLMDNAFYSHLLPTHPAIADSEARPDQTDGVHADLEMVRDVV